jgi:hypothetical protein
MKDAIRRKASEGTAVLLSSHLLAVVSNCAPGDRAGPWQGAGGGIAGRIAARARRWAARDAVLDLLTE